MTWTRSPTAHGRPFAAGPTSAPISTISPAISWPMIRGGTMFWWPELVDLDVGAAGRAVADPDLDLGRAGRRLGSVLDPDVARRVEAGDLHAWALLGGCPGRRAQQRQDIVDVGRVAEGGSAVGFDEDLGERRQDADVLVAARRDGDAEVDGLAVPVDAVGELEEPEGVRRTSARACVRAVGDGDAFAHVRGDLALALEHRGGVALVDRAELLQQRPGLAQRVPLVVGVLRQPDGLADEDARRWGGGPGSVGKGPTVPDRRFDLLEGRVAQEELERHDDRARRDPPRPLGEARSGRPPPRRRPGCR